MASTEHIRTIEQVPFVSARTLSEACNIMRQTGAVPIAGGTVILPRMRQGRLHPCGLVDLTHISELVFVEQQGDRISIGAGVTLAAVSRSSLVQTAAPALAHAAGLVGGVQTRYRATLGGNIANASPAADCLPPLLALDATVRLVSADRERTLSVSDFLVGPGCIAAVPDELVHSISFARPASQSRMLYLKLGNRRGMAIAVASVAVVLALDAKGHVHHVRIALGSVAPTAIRCVAAEAALQSRAPDSDTIRTVASVAAAGCSPIDDVRASAEYRRHAVGVLVARALHEVLKLARQQES